MKKLLLYIFVCFTTIQIHAQSPELWGMTFSGGINNVGTIFKTDSNGNNHVLVHEFIKYEGAFPKYTELCEASNGKLYGMTREGGANEMGVLFEYEPSTNTYSKKLDFNGAANGRKPYGSLIQASNGKLYGMTAGGGTNDMGVLFEYDPSTNTYTKILDFNGAVNGSEPYGSLMQASNGKLYGMTLGGGTNNFGVLFEYNPSTNTYTKKFDFNSTNGGAPYGSLMQASNGKLYGMTRDGGTNYSGVLFEYEPTTSTYTKKFDFNVTDGVNPFGSLMQASNGKLYGMTEGGGTNGKGVLFEYDPTTSTYTKKLDFNDIDGSYPQGSLMQASNGKLYGMTSYGGAGSSGVLFEYEPITNTYTKKLDFNYIDGENPLGSLMQASNGKLYGMTSEGGTNDMGVLFEYDPTTEIYINKIDFNEAGNGRYPRGLMQASNGKLYGMTTAGGADYEGVLFEYDPTTSTYTKKLDFNYIDGSHPQSSLMQASNGKLYGMTLGGGTNNFGVLFEYEPITNTYTKKLDFNYIDGEYPLGSLMQASNGKLYGMTSEGGTNDMGVLFEYDPTTSTYTKKLDFNDIDGSYPYGSLMQASNGKLYGMTREGGANEMGVLFEYEPSTNTYTKKLDFNDIDGSYPQGSLMQASNGKLYGMTSYGGAGSSGVLFEYEPITNTYTKKLDFNDIDGQYPFGSLMQASNGKLYGMTSEGGTNDMGVLFEYHPTTNTYTKKLDFNGINGISPNGDLIEVTTNVIGIKEQITNNIKIYPNPSKGILYIETEQKQKFELYNSFGEMVYVHQLQIGKNNLKLPNLATGVYYIKLFNKSTTIVERLMIHHQ